MPHFQPRMNFFQAVLTPPATYTAGTAATFSSPIFKMTANTGYSTANTANVIYVPGNAYKTEVLIRVADKSKVTNNATGSCIPVNLMGSWDGNNFFSLGSYTDVANGSGAISVKEELVPAHANFFRIDFVLDTTGALTTGHGIVIDLVIEDDPVQGARACFYGTSVNAVASPTFSLLTNTTSGETWSSQTFSSSSVFLIGTNTQQAISAVAISYGTITGVTAVVSVIQAGSASQYPSQVITFTGTAGGTSGNITVDGKTTAITVGDTAAAIAFKIAATTYTTTTSTENWTAKGGGVLIITGTNTKQSVAGVTVSAGSVGNVTVTATQIVAGSGSLYPQQAIVFVGGGTGLLATTTFGTVTIDGVALPVTVGTTAQTLSTTFGSVMSSATASGGLTSYGSTLTIPGNNTAAAISAGSITVPITYNDCVQKLYATAILVGTPLVGSNATIALQGSLDGANWYTVSLTNAAVSASAGTIVVNEVISNSSSAASAGAFVGNFFRLNVVDGATTGWLNSSTAYLYTAITALY